MLALRDERRAQLAPTRALEIAGRYYQHADEPVELGKLAGEWMALGYRDVVLRALARALALEPLPPERLMAAAAQRVRGQEWLARFYEEKARELSGR